MQGIRFADGQVGYRFIPKVACTSLKEAIYKFENGEDFKPIEGGARHIHSFYGRRHKDIDDCSYRVVVVRDPIKRFLSGYGNRVTHHRELSKEKVEKRHPELLNQFSVFDPDLSTFISNLDDYMKVDSISHHVKPFTEFTGEDMSYYTHVLPIEKIHQFVELVVATTNSEFAIGRSQTGGKKFTYKDLTKDQLEFLFDFLSIEYQVLRGLYSVDKVWKAWKA